MVLTAPIFKALKEEGYETALITRSRFKNIMSNDPNIDSIIPAEAAEAGKISLSSDILIDLQGNLRSRKLSGRIKAGTKARVRKYYLCRFLLTSLHLKIALPPVIKRYKAAAERALKKDLTLTRLKYFPGEIPPIDIPHPYITLSLNAKWFTKSYPYTEELINIILKTTDFNILLVGGTEIPVDSKRVFNAGTDHPIERTAALVKGSLLAVTSDTVWMHIEMGLDVPTIAVFGSTHPDLGFISEYNMPRIVLGKQLSCRPCTKIGKKRCPKKHFFCLKGIPPKIIMEQIKDAINFNSNS